MNLTLVAPTPRSRALMQRGTLLALLLAVTGCAGGAGASMPPRSSSSSSETARERTPSTARGAIGQGSDDGERRATAPAPLEGSPTATSSGSPYAAEFAGAPALETLTGRASYYSDRLAGRSTASGEPYRTSDFTAASRDLRFGTILRVTREDTGTVTYVRVNDRGPFGDQRRIVDLSRAAAEDLDMIRAGVVSVRVEIVQRPTR